MLRPYSFRRPVRMFVVMAALSAFLVFAATSFAHFASGARDARTLQASLSKVTPPASDSARNLPAGAREAPEGLSGALCNLLQGAEGGTSLAAAYLADTTAPATSPWTLQTSGTGNSLEGVDFADDLHGCAVGGIGTVLTTSTGGATWSLQDPGTTADLQAVDFVDALHGWSVGYDWDSFEGVILATADGGVNWSSQASGTGSALADVVFADSSTGWAVGEFGTVLHTADGGATWLAQDCGWQDDLHAVEFIDADHGWAVGDWGAVFHTANGGVTWTRQDATTEAHLRAVDFTDASHGWVIGWDSASAVSVVLVTEDGGSSWARQTTVADVPLRAISFADALHGWVVGDYGTILKTASGGAEWTLEASGTEADLTAVCFPSLSVGWAVGAWGVTLARSDTTAPTTSASGADEAWHNTPVEIAFTASDGSSGEGVAYTEYKLDDAAWAKGTTAVVPAPADHSGDGTHTLLYRSADLATPPNIEDPPGSVTVKVDTTPPAGSLAINDGASTTVSHLVTLESAVADANGVVEMRVSSDGGQTWDTWRANEATLSVSLSLENGLKTVCAQYRDPAGNVRELTDTIVLDMTTDETAPVTIDDSDGQWYRESVTVHLSADDTESGLAVTNYRVDGGPWRRGAEVTLNAGKRGLNSGPHTIDFYSADYAGNVEQVRTCVVYLDGRLPQTSDDAVASTYTGPAAVTLMAIDGDSGPSAIDWCLDDGPWQEYSCAPGPEGSQVQVDLWVPDDGANDGIHTLSYCAIDEVGNRERVHTIGLTIKNGTTLRHEESAARLRFTGDWQTRAGAAFSGRKRPKQKVLDSAGSVRVGFDGSGIAIYATRGPDMGIAAVSLDGEPAGSIDFYAPTPLSQQKVLAMTSFTDAFPASAHTLTIEWTGTKVEASTGTAIALDAVEIVGALVAAPDPLSVAASSAPGARVSATIGAATGGVMTTTGPDGTVYRLDIPAGVLVADTEITMTPTTGIGGLPMTGGLVGGVELEPEGTTLIMPATLTITPGTLTPGSLLAVGYVYEDQGREFSLTDAALQDDRVVLSVSRFSGHGAGLATDVDITMMQATHAPSRPRAAAQQMNVLHMNPVAEVDELKARALSALSQVSRGGGGDMIEAAACAREYFDAAARTGLNGDYTTVEDELVRAYDSAWNKAYFHCVAYKDISAFQDLVRMYRIAAKLGPEYCKETNIDLVSRWNDIVNCNYWTVELASRRGYAITDGHQRGLLFRNVVTCSGTTEVHGPDPEAPIQESCIFDQGSEAPRDQGKDWEGHDWLFSPQGTPQDILSSLKLETHLMALPATTPDLTVTIAFPDHDDIMGQMSSVYDGHESHVWGPQDGWSTIRYRLWCDRGHSYPGVPSGTSVLADDLEDRYVISDVPAIAMFESYTVKEDFQGGGNATFDMTGISPDVYGFFGDKGHPQGGGVAWYQFLDMDSVVQSYESTWIGLKFTPHWVGPPPYFPE